MTSLPNLKSSFSIHYFVLKEHILTWAVNLRFLIFSCSNTCIDNKVQLIFLL